MPEQELLSCLNKLVEGQAVVFDEYVFILCGPGTHHSLFFIQESFILASACPLKTGIPDQYRTIICTAAMLNQNTNSLVQNFNACLGGYDRNLFDALPNRFLFLHVRFGINLPCASVLVVHNVCVAL